MNPSVEALENQYFLLRGSLAAVSGKGATPEQLDELRAQIVQSRTNYWTATNSILHDDDPQVRNLVSALNGEQLSLDTTIKNMADVSKIIEAVTKAVDIGSQLAAKAVSL